MPENQPHLATLQASDSTNIAGIQLLDSVFTANVSTYDTIVIHIPETKLALTNEALRTLPSSYLEPQSRNMPTAVLPTLLMLSAVLLIAYAKAFERRRYKQLYKSFFDNIHANQLLREEKLYSHTGNMLIGIAACLVVPLFMQQAAQSISFSPYDLKGLPLYLAFLIGILLFQLVHFFILWLMSFLFEIESLISEYVLTIYLSLLAGGVLLLPFSMLHEYLPVSKPATLLTGAFLLLILFIFRSYTGFLQAKKQGAFFIYIFLYFCTLEILPLAVLFVFLQRV